MYEGGGGMPLSGKALKRLRSESMDSRASTTSSPLSRAASDGGYSRAPELTIQEKRARVLIAKIDNLTEEQAERFEFFSRSHFDKDVIKKCMTDAFTNIKARSGDGMRDQARHRKVDVSEQMVIIMGALCKLFVGDLVRNAVALRSQRCEDEPISPRHIREAYRRALRNKELPLLRGTSVMDVDTS